MIRGMELSREMPELRQCPFCGGGAELSTAFNYVCEDWIAEVRCVDCFAQMKSEQDMEADAVSDVVDAWNGRMFKDAAESVRSFAERFERKIAERDGLIRDLFRLVHYGPCRAACDHFDKDTCGIDLNDGVCWYEVKLNEMGVEL